MITILRATECQLYMGSHSVCYLPPDTDEHVLKCKLILSQVDHKHVIHCQTGRYFTSVPHWDALTWWLVILKWFT